MMNTRVSTVALSILWFVSSITPAAAQSSEHESSHEAETEHDFHPNLLAVFFGVTEEGREEGFAVGIEYERRLNKSFGIGLLAERTGELDLNVYAIPFAFHAGAWKLYAAPGIEDGEHGSESLIRLGIEYGFEVGQFEIAPQLDVDFVDGEEVYVMGITIGKGF
jgi:hypothetical protein